MPKMQQIKKNCFKVCSEIFLGKCCSHKGEYLFESKKTFVAKCSHMKLIGSHQLCIEIQQHTKGKR